MTPTAATNDWKISTLHAYLLVIIQDNKEAVDTAHISMERAIVKAEANTEKRFDVMNENVGKRFDAANGFRAAMQDQANTYISRMEVTGSITNLSEKLDLLSARVDKNEGARSGINAVWLVILGIGTLASSAAALLALFKH